MSSNPIIVYYSGTQGKDTSQVQRSSSEQLDQDSVKEANEKVAVASTTLDISDDSSTDSVKEVFDIEAIDPVLSKKMALANKVIDDWDDQFSMEDVLPQWIRICSWFGMSILHKPFISREPYVAISSH